MWNHSSSGLETNFLLEQKMSAGLIVVNRDQRIVQANEAARTLLTIPADCIGKKLSKVTRYYEPLLSSSIFEERERFYVISGDGRRRVVQFTSESIDHDEYRLIFLWDVTRLVENEERCLRAQQLRAAGRMSTRLNHEMRDPLAVIFAGIQSLQGSSTLSEEDSAGLGLVLEAARSVVRILNRFVDSSYSGATGAALVAVSHLLEVCIDDLKSTAGSKGVVLELLRGPQIELFIHEQAMSRAIKNLIHNSLDACKSGDSVKIGWRELGESEKAAKLPGFTGKVVGIYGEDSGRGLPRDLSETSIFKPFVTTKSSGTGLGLSVSQETIELQGGVISLASLPTGGSVFEILLPAGEPVACWENKSQEHTENICCDPCEVKKTSKVGFCWAIKGGEHRAQTGYWLQQCQGCSLFRSANLAVYFSRSGRAPGKE